MGGIVLGLLATEGKTPAQEFPPGAWRDSLESVEIRAPKQRPVRPLEARWVYFSPGGRGDTVSRTQREVYGMESLASLLTDQYPVFVHRYGVNGMASLSMRGASSAQTQVYWNGIPIQNPALGQADLSDLAVELMEEIRLIYGGGGALWGSGQVGGGLVLGSGLPFSDSGRRHSLRVKGGAGSFGQGLGSLQWTHSAEKVAWSLGYRQAGARNDFPYDHPNRGSVRMDHARAQSRAWMAQGAARFGKIMAQTSVWAQDGQREIPAALFESRSTKGIEDQSLRWSLNLDRESQKSRTYLIGGWTWEQSRFEDQAIGLQSGIRSQQVYAEAGWEHRLGNRGRWRLFAPLQWAWALTEDGRTRAFQQQRALATALALPFARKGRVAASLRWAAADGPPLLLPSISMGYQATSWGRISGNFQRSYRQPSLFERYIQPGGNPDLRPEQGWNLDMGVDLEFHLASFGSIRHSSAGFFRWIDDWVFWMGGSIWTPHNLHAVFSRGWETDTRWEQSIGNFHWSLGGRTAYILSTQGPSTSPGFSLEGFQIPYSPRYRAQAMARLSWEGWSLQYTHGYTGYRFTSLDESQFLQPYQLGHLRLGWASSKARHPWQVQVQLLNLWNTPHQLAAFRPMPGRHFMVGIQRQFNWLFPHQGKDG